MVINDYVNNLEENVVSVNTFTNTDAPIIQVRYFNPVVGTGSTLRIPYYVSDRHIVDKTEWKLEDTFTTIIKIGSDTYKKTTYAGEQFMDIEMPSSAGDTYFSIQCVDSSGVESSIQYFDLSVRGQETENVYAMQESDLETYGIVCNDTDDDIAYNNKASLSNLFASVKEGGYTKIVMLNRTYYINYHAKNNGAYVSNAGGDNIVFPNNFTIDLNGATIQAIQSDDLNSGRIIEIKENYNTHIINGNIVSSYNGFDFQTTSTKTQKPVPAEGLVCVNVLSSTYCSLDNLDVSNSVGYELAFSRNTNTMDVQKKYHVTFDANKYIDYNGNEVNSETMMIGTSYIPVSKSFDELIVGVPLGYGGYFGSEREIFVSFYDSNKDFISTIKSKQHWCIKIPDGTSYVRVSAYGTSESLNANYPSGINIYYQHSCKNCEVKNCTIHDTRTVGFSPCSGNHILFKNNTYYNIANESGTWQVTKLFGDIEDSWQQCRNIYFFDNEFRYGDTSQFTIMYITNLNFIGNRGISLSLAGGMEGTLVKDSYIPTLSIDFSFRSYYPQMFFKSCRIGSLSLDTSGASSRNDTRVAMENCYIDTKNDSSLLRLRNCKNGAS